MDHGLRVVLRLVFNELANTVPDTDKAADALLGGGRYRYRTHEAVFPEVQLALHNGETKIPHIGVGGQITRFFLLKIIQIYGLYLTLDMTNSGSQQRFQTLTLVGDTGGFHTIGAGYLLHFT